MFRATLSIAALMWLAGCARSTAEKTEPAPSAAPPAASVTLPYKQYGGAITLNRTEPLATVLTQPERFTSEPVLVEGKVRRACSRKGCWMELAASDAADAPRCRVTFKDYAFFVPTDSQGAEARVQAVAVVEKVKKEYVEHLESEGAQFAHKNPDGTADEVRLVATAVELRK